MAEDTEKDTGSSSVPAVTRRVAYFLALAALVLPCGLLIVAIFWLYRHLRALFARRATATAPADR